ncbi:MAG: hypothetical protein K2G88_04015 [Oscillospiraceae bacterium]|nr:hypothetical protein [Oscillospiraceae bacterium]
MTNLQQKKINWLRRAKDAEYLIQALGYSQRQDMALIKELELYENCDNIKNHLASLQEQKQKKLILLANIREEIAQVITSVCNMQLQAILNRKYLAYQTIEQIAEDMFFDRRSIQRKHKQALDLLEIPVVNSNIRNDNFLESNL